jgi:hypothetical protein
MIDILAPDNRLLPRITKTRDQLARRVRRDNEQPLPADFDLVAFERTLDNSLAEHFRYQQLQAEAHAMGRLTTAEAQTIYVALGDPPGVNGWSEVADLATKLVVTEVLMELLQRRIVQ